MLTHCPQYTDKENLELAKGAIDFQKNVIKNLRQQIENLRESLSVVGMSVLEIDEIQYKHLLGEINAE